MTTFEELHDKVKEGQLDAAAQKVGALNWRLSIIDLLKATGKDSSLEARTKLASEVGIEHYTGTAAQNDELHNAVIKKLEESGTNLMKLHERLIALQSDEELERKWRKAEGRWSNRYWAQEWLDLADRQAQHMYEYLASGVSTQSRLKGSEPWDR
jgi:hypothetical protein